MRRLGLALTTAFVLLALARPAQADLPRPERKLIEWTNSWRYNDLGDGWRLRVAAEAHAHKMADAGRIFHGTSLSFQYRTCFGQNVGVGTSYWKVWDAFMKSWAHRSNILNPCFKYIGVGVVYQGGYYWIVMNFGSPPHWSEL